MQNSKAIHALKKLFDAQISHRKYEKVFWLRSLQYSKAMIQFVTESKGNLLGIINYKDKELSNESDFLTIYLCKSNEIWEMVLVYSPIEFLESDRVIDVIQVSIQNEDLENTLKLTPLW